jgi:hypothetical protein
VKSTYLPTSSARTPSPYHCLLCLLSDTHFLSLEAGPAGGWTKLIEHMGIIHTAYIYIYIYMAVIVCVCGRVCVCRSGTGRRVDQAVGHRLLARLRPHRPGPHHRHHRVSILCVCVCVYVCVCVCVCVNFVVGPCSPAVLTARITAEVLLHIYIIYIYITPGGTRGTGSWLGVPPLS